MSCSAPLIRADQESSLFHFLLRVNSKDLDSLCVSGQASVPTYHWVERPMKLFSDVAANMLILVEGFCRCRPMR
jgi:hypothetical protein